MSIDLATVAMMGAVQAVLMALVLWTSTGSYAGVARASLRIRSTALVLEAVAWVLLGLRGQVGDWLSILVANAVLLSSYALTVRALRMLLDVPQRQRLVIAATVLGWLGIVWFTWVMPDFGARVICVTAVVLLDLTLLIAPLVSDLRRRRSAARRVLLMILAISAVMVCWRAVEQLLQAHAANSLLLASPLNVLFIAFSATQPLFTTIGFLLVYNEAMQDELKSLARIDPLTGVGNRLALIEQIGRLLKTAARDRTPLGAMMLDADHFKSVNDRFGHSGGDAALRALSSTIRQVLGRGEVFGRIGGEEFVVLSPGSDLRRMLALGERIRSAVAATSLVLEGQAVKMTVSVGVTMALPGEREVSSLLRRTDTALYMAKRAGRDCVMAEGEMPAQAI